MERKKSRSSSSVTFVFSNEDLMIQILLFLPAKSVLKFQSVNKQWHTIISSDHFSRLHTLYYRHRPKPSPTFLLSTGRQQFFYFSPVAKSLRPVRFMFPFTYIIHSSHGLLLLECRSKQYGLRNYYIYNLTTNRYRKLLLNNIGDGSKATIPGLCLIFDPDKSPDYKIVCIWKLPSVSQYKIEIYLGNSRSWKTVGETPQPITASRFTIFSNGIWWNDKIYWIRPSSVSYLLDLDTGKFGMPPTVRLPPRKTGQSNKNYVLESNGHLHCVAHYSRWNQNSMTVFEMEGTKSSWFVKYVANLNPVADVFKEMNGPEVGILGLTRGEREEESAVLIHIPEKIICYWFCGRRFEIVLDMKKFENIISEYGEDSLMFIRSDAHQFIENLAPV